MPPKLNINSLPAGYSIAGSGGTMTQLNINSLPQGYSIAGTTPPPSSPIPTQQNPQTINQNYNSGKINAADTVIQDVGEAAKETNQALTNPAYGLNPVGDANAAFQGLTGLLGKGISAVAKPIGNAIGGGLRSLVGAGTADKIGQKVLGNPTVQAVNKELTSPAVAGDVGAVGNMAGLAGTVAGVSGVGEALPDLAESPVGEKAGQIFSRTPSDENAVNDVIDKNYSKAVKPTIAGKNTNAQVSAYNDSAQSAVKSIVANKDNLSFTNSDGETETGRLPKTRQEFSDAVAQTKKTIFDQYDALQKQAGNSGATVDLKPVADELDTIINNKALQISNPSSIEYARNMKERLLGGDMIDTGTAQELIKNYNDKLNAFYRNPNASEVSNNAVDSFVANKLRSTLDETIANSTGEQYQPLKNAYGDLKTIEKDVTKSAVRGANLNKTGLVGSLANIGSGAELAKALFTMNPADFAYSAGMKGFSTLYAYLNNPDTSISSMFNKVDSYYQNQVPQQKNP